jgi:LysM repeat protein
MGSSSRWLYALLFIILTSSLLIGCTRERAALETGEAEGSGAVVLTETTPIAEPEVTLLPVGTPGTTPAAEPTPTPTTQHGTIPHQVQPGDMVSTIAEKYGTTSQVIRELNLLTNDNLLVGQVLRVPNNPDAAAERDGTPTPTPGPYSYTVQAGDTLYSIAIAHDVSANEIVAVNMLQSPNSIFVGQRLIIPGYQSEAPAGAASGEPYQYVIQAGDTLFSIAMRFGVSASAILEANSLRNADSLVAGQTLLIPGYQPPASAGGSAGSTQGSNAPAIHVVKTGETLSMIAQRYGVTVAAIISANNLANPNRVQAGQQLRIPGKTMADIAAANQIIHTVAPGEGLGAIARRYGVTVAEIVEANNIADPNLVKVGEKLIIPQQ